MLFKYDGDGDVHSTLFDI